MRNVGIFLLTTFCAFLIGFPNFVNSYSGWIYDNNKVNCAVLYSGSNYSLGQFAVPNKKVVNDLSELELEIPKPKARRVKREQFETENWDKRPASVKIFDGCRLKACDGTHLDGKCAWFDKTLADVGEAWKNQISSVGCSCPVDGCGKARCPKIKFRTKDCGRAFLEPSCQVCGGEFISIKKDSEQPVFGSQYENKIKSLVVNKGCNLTYFNEPDFEGEEFVLKAGVHEEFDATLGSYKCVCDKVQDTPVKAPVNPKYPKLLDMPISVEEIQALAKRFPGHAGLDAALTSIRHKRSPKTAYILLIGLTGSGKSTTINFLFDNSSVCAVGAQQSTTSAIHEIKIPIQVDELGCKNCELRVIDTPGFGDTNGLEMDAKFLAGLEAFLDSHEELRHRIPNIILIFSKFTDNRFDGKNSPFVKTLRGVELFKQKLFDMKYSNSITVLTHFMSENKRVVKNPAAKLRQIRQTIGDYTLFPKPITTVVGENRPEDQELPMVNGYYKLPNGEYYPQNLFEKIQEATEKGNDPIGEAIIRTAFKFPENFKISFTEFPLKNVTFSREHYFLSELIGANFNIDMTEVSNITAEVYREKIKADLKRKFPGTLEYVQRVLNLRNIATKENIPRTTVEILKLFKNIRQNALVENLLFTAFDLRVPTLEIPLLAGQSYNVLKDVVLPISPFEITSYQGSDMGFKLPNTLTSTLINEQAPIFNMYDTNQEYIKDRLSQLKIAGKVREGLIWDSRPGYNNLETYRKERSITTVREYRLFQLTLNDNAKFNKAFEERVRLIPPFDPQNHTIVDDWKHFFATYGTHVVSSAFGGGAIEIGFRVKNQTGLTEEGQLKAIKKSIEDLIKFMDDIYMGKSLPAHDIDTSVVKYALNFRGGDFGYAVPDFSGVSVDQISTLLDGFRESLEYQPAMLQSSLSLVPLSVLAKKLNTDYSYKISNATASLLNATLTYVPPPPPLPPLERPEVKKHINELKANLQSHIDRLSAEMKTSRETFEKFTKELIEQNALERKKMQEALANEERNTKQAVSLACAYEQLNLKGGRVCTAEQTTCLSVYMKTVRSVNTYNSCVQFFNDNFCTGTPYRHISNETHNTKFPFDLAEGGRFGVLKC